MSETDQLSMSEKALLQRVLSMNLDRVKRGYCAFFGLGSLFLVIEIVVAVAVFRERDIELFCVFVGLLVGIICALGLGAAWFGYYRVYRLLHHQDTIIERMRHTLGNEG